jgi:hypothetical protein
MGIFYHFSIKISAVMLNVTHIFKQWLICKACAIYGKPKSSAKKYKQIKRSMAIV